MTTLLQRLQQADAIVQVANALQPILLNTIMTVEAIVPHTPGVEKFNAVINRLSAGFGQVQQTLVTFEQLAPLLAAQINGIVAAFNHTGVFTTSQPQPPVPVPTGDPAHT